MADPSFPLWLTIVSWTSLAIAGVCAAVIAADVAARPQKMGVMNAVWPLTALFGSLLWLAGYYRWGRKTFAVWILDYILAFLIGIAFQYFSIAPMRNLSMKQGVIQAIKIDFLSITAWQVGMYGLMAILQFAWFRRAFGGLAPVDSPEFWFAMQIAILAGFCTSYPVNWLLIRICVKEAM